MKEEQMNAALDAIYERAEVLMGLTRDPDIRRIADEILALSRYKCDVIGDKTGNSSKD